MSHIETNNVVFSDHDGTLTDTTQEEASYKPIFIEFFSQTSGLSIYDAEERINSTLATILDHPERYGWNMNGFIVAPATCDHIQRMQAAGRQVMNEVRSERNLPPLADGELDKLMYQLYQQSYALSETHYKPDAQDFVAELHRKRMFTIVTNSGTEDVRKKLRILLAGTNIDAEDISIMGDARKWYVDPSSPMPMRLLGLPRDVFVGRPYFDAVFANTPLRVLAMIGDIWELDNTVPEKRGIFTILATSPYTVPWEYAHYDTHPNGSRVGTLYEALDVIGQL